jgi:hypothetical protein
VCEKLPLVCAKRRLDDSAARGQVAPAAKAAFIASGFFDELVGVAMGG